MQSVSLGRGLGRLVDDILRSFLVLLLLAALLLFGSLLLALHVLLFDHRMMSELALDTMNTKNALNELLPVFQRAFLSLLDLASLTLRFGLLPLGHKQLLVFLEDTGSFDTKIRFFD